MFGTDGPDRTISRTESSPNIPQIGRIRMIRIPEIGPNSWTSHLIVGEPVVLQTAKRALLQRIPSLTITKFQQVPKP